MTDYIFDTNIVSLLLRNDKDVTQRMSTTIRPEDTIIGCPVVWYEIRRGLLAKDAKKQMERFEKLFAVFQWQDYTRDDWKQASEIWSSRRKSGKPISDADLLIGVFAQNRNAILVTDNEKDFVDLTVTIENWKNP